MAPSFDLPFDSSVDCDLVRGVGCDGRYMYIAYPAEGGKAAKRRRRGSQGFFPCLAGDSLVRWVGQDGQGSQEGCSGSTGLHDEEDARKGKARQAKGRVERQSFGEWPEHPKARTGQADRDRPEGVRQAFFQHRYGSCSLARLRLSKVRLLVPAPTLLPFADARYGTSYPGGSPSAANKIIRPSTDYHPYSRRGSEHARPSSARPGSSPRSDRQTVARQHVGRTAERCYVLTTSPSLATCLNTVQSVERVLSLDMDQRGRHSSLPPRPADGRHRPSRTTSLP
ncbi:uncharacterized protein PSFLO_05204 [Pseudozyma flocculosa]|uniref:Uncharacterized protein n=1 Tax=Pseudozyma flocculosa TaxID=84751 RepID=A0A5C3F5E5_9BASI|nr:uncharacterized protein PSFLO_05204 [Pseudozyma flocculosa]